MKKMGSSLSKMDNFNTCTEIEKTRIESASLKTKTADKNSLTASLKILNHRAT
jgi:hypothetical protein